MITTVSSMNIKYDGNKVDSAEIHFTMREEDYSVNTSGYYIFTKEEFEGKTVDQLIEQIKEKHVERILNPFDEEKPEEEE